ncbi:MAG: cation:proton antiporter subunit C [Spirochaetes bacterium]|nr:cation:proton antiporter subunit C [Spirochaetota bacterium]
MIDILISNYIDIVSIILYGIGFTTLLVDRNLVKKVIGLNISYAAVYLLLGSKGYVSGRIAPIIVDGVQDASLYVNPIPSGLILTGIVISVSVTAFAIALIIDLYNRFHTLNLDEIMLKVSQEKEE